MYNLHQLQWKSLFRDITTMYITIFHLQKISIKIFLIKYLNSKFENDYNVFDWVLVVFFFWYWVVRDVACTYQIVTYYNSINYKQYQFVDSKLMRLTSWICRYNTIILSTIKQLEVFANVDIFDKKRRSIEFDNVTSLTFQTLLTW